MEKSQRILIVGGSGFLGSELGIDLAEQGYRLNLLTRSESQQILSFPAKVYEWNDDGTIPQQALNEVDIIINLAGESIALGRWTSNKKNRIRSSRVSTADAVVEAAKKNNIKLVLQASAVGYYGDTGSKAATESNKPGNDFLAKTAIEWEEPLQKLESSTRKVTMRFGVIFGTTGGPLQEILTPYIMGLGATIGSGKQYISWIHVKDICRFISEAIEDSSFSGAYNLTAPNPITYYDLHLELTKFFGGLKWLSVPGFVFKLALGEKSSILLASQKVTPSRAQQQNFEFKFPDIRSCLRDLLTEVNLDCGIIHTKQWIPLDLKQVWDFFSTEKNLEVITPPWLHFHVTGMSTSEIKEGTEISYQLRLHGIPVKWKSKIVNFKPTEQFQDIQLQGPYKTWHHTHYFKELAGGTLIEDFVKYQLPFGRLGKLFGFPLVRIDSRKIFNYRKKKIQQIFRN